MRSFNCSICNVASVTVNVAFVQIDGSQVWQKQNAIYEFDTPRICSRKLLLKRMKIKKVII